MPNSQIKFAVTDESLQNPYIGFTSFQHFRGEPLFSDCDTAEGWLKEHYPVYESVAQNGRSQGFYPDTEIAYIRMLWKDFEPEEGKFNYTLSDAIFQKAAECGQSVMFRLMPHTTKSFEDVPDWLRVQIDCPERPEAARVKDSPPSPIFLEKFAHAIEAFGARYDGLDSFYAMDISLSGAWGEGHGYFTYPEKSLKALIDAYTKSFKKTHLLGQICAPALVNYGNLTRPVGFRADGLGEDHHMTVYFPKNIFEMQDVWKKAPVSFETFWQLTEWQRRNWDIDGIIEESLSWHVSSINAKSSPIPYEWKDKIEKWLKKMGYRFSLRLFEYPSEASAGDSLLLVMRIQNNGVAPLYNALPFELCLKNDVDEIHIPTDIDARHWMPGDYIERFEIFLPNNVKSGKYSVFFRLGGGKSPFVSFACDTERDKDGFHYLCDVNVV